MNVEGIDFVTKDAPPTVGNRPVLVAFSFRRLGNILVADEVEVVEEHLVEGR